MFAYLNGHYLPRSAAMIPVDDRGFIFGDGVYEVWRVINGRLFETDRHLARLAFGLGELRIPVPPIIHADALTEIADRLLAESGLTEGEATLYVEVTRGVAPRSHQFPAGGTAPTVYVTVNRFSPPEDVRRRGASCITIPDIRWMRCDIKSIQLLPNVMAKQAAVEAGAIDAIMIRGGNLTEGSHANVAAVLDGVIRTHPADNLILHGITRAVVLDIARALDFRVSEEAVNEADIPRLDELFLVGTTTDVMPVTSLNGQPVGSGAPGPITTRLVSEFRSYLDAACGVAQPIR